MKSQSQLHSSRLAIAVVVLGGAIAGMVGSFIVTAQRDDGDRVLPLADPSTFPPPPMNQWIIPGVGVFRAYTWDERPISDEAKAAQPWYDPRWKPFSDCMVAEGYEVRKDPAQPFGQADMDEIVRRANEERPDRKANQQIGSDVADLQGIAGAYLRCAGEWMGLPTEEWPRRGIEKLEPGELPPP